MTTKDLESAARAVENLLQTSLGGALDDEEARWSAIDPIILDNPNTWALGKDLSLYFLDFEQDEFPVVAVLAGRLDAIVEGSGYADQLGWQAVQAVVFVDFCVEDEDVETCAKIAWRYGQAVIATLQSMGDYGGWQRVYHHPDIGYMPVSRQIDESASADEFYHTQVGRVELTVSR